MITKTEFGTPFETFAITQPVPQVPQVRHFAVTRDGSDLIFTCPLADGDIVYGLGETMGGLNKRGGRYISYNKDDANHTDSNPSLYASHNFLIVDGSAHFGVFFDTPAVVTFEIDRHDSGLIRVTCEGGNVKVYEIEEDTSYAIAKTLLRAIGRSYLPPLWAFGYCQSRFGYKCEQDFLDVVKGHEEAGLPLDAICMDIDYMEGFADFTVNKKRFPDLKGFATELLQKGIHLVPIVDAGIKVDKKSPIWREGVEKGWFCRNREGGYFKAGVWPGMTHFPDVLNPDARAWFGQQYRFYTDQGIEGFWNDMNEPAIFYSQYTRGIKKLTMILDMMYADKRRSDKERRLLSDYKSFFHNVDGKLLRHYDVHNIYGYFMTMAASEALDKLLGHRFLLFSRSSYIGAGRYGGIWTGDNSSCWEHLKLNLLHIQSVNICGFLYSGADTGGFMGSVTRELLLRWLALSAFTPLMRNHTGGMGARQECYAFDHVEDFRAILSLRYRLIPYLYSEYMKAALRRDLFMKPLAFGFPEDSRARTIDDQPLVGGSIMMAPILEEGATSRTVYLPDDMTMVKYDGHDFVCTPANRGEMTVHCQLNEVVFFILKDHLVPIGAEIQNTRQVDFDHLTLLGDGGSYELYADDGLTKDVSPDNIRILKQPE